MALLASRPCWQCDHCGTIVCPEPAADGLRVTGEPGHSCPVCHLALVRAVIDDRDRIEICERCKGVFMARRAFAVTLTARRHAARTPTVTPVPADPHELERRIACPNCGRIMLTDRYYGPGNIIIDTCPTCDVVWLDAGELGRAVDAPGPDRPRDTL
jgi:Zn-finger nucleic acid-binding protein